MKYRVSVCEQDISKTYGSRVLERQGSTVTKNTPLDKYLSRPEDEVTSWYNFIRKLGKVPVISGSQIRATWPLDEEYCRTMLLLHWPNWRSLNEIGVPEETWCRKMEHFLQSNDCPSFVKADIERARRHAKDGAYSDQEDIPSENDCSDMEQPE